VTVLRSAAGSPKQDRGDRRPSLVDVAKVAAEDLLDLFTAQIKLARLELAADLREALKRFVWVALFIPPLLVGYAFGMAAIASWLAEYWGRPVALASVAALQIVAAGTGIVWSLSALGRARILKRASTEMAETVQRTIAAVSDPARSSNG
jgi:uncharacterized membrane protein YqjE